MPRENTDDLELAYYRETYAGFVGGIAEGRKLHYETLLAGNPEVGGTEAVDDLKAIYLRDLGYTGTLPDMEKAYLASLGYIGALADMRNQYFYTFVIFTLITEDRFLLTTEDGFLLTT